MVEEVENPADVKGNLFEKSRNTVKDDKERRQVKKRKRETSSRRKHAHWNSAREIKASKGIRALRIGPSWTVARSGTGRWHARVIARTVSKWRVNGSRGVPSWPRLWHADCVSILSTLRHRPHNDAVLFSNWKERARLFGKLELANRKKRSVVQFSHGIRAAPTSLYSAKVVERCTVSPWECCWTWCHFSWVSHARKR